MDPVKVEKLQAMRRYRALQYRFVVNFVQYCLSLVCFGLFLSSPLWLPKLFAALRHFAAVVVPSMAAYLFCPKCFFVLGNVIVVFLVGESKLSGAAPAADIYDEYMQHRKGAGSARVSVPSCGEEEEAEAATPASAERSEEETNSEEEKDYEEEEEEEAPEEEDEEDIWGEEGRESECFDGEEEPLPADELNRRIEDFIARVNRQRRIEAALFACCG